MTIKQRIAALVRLGEQLLLPSPLTDQAIYKAIADNPWFEETDIRQALAAIVAQYLSADALLQWASQYALVERSNPKIVGTVLAGNIPLVGFHDVLCIFMSGHIAQIKLSSKDTALIHYLVDLLCQIDAQCAHYLQIVHHLKDFDAVIATGSNNSSRYFEYYFGKYPHIIRRNRSAVAVLSGSETNNDFLALGSDVFSYCGLGCRNISKLFVPINYTFDALLDAWQPFGEMMMRDRYKSNYDYQRTLLLLNKEPHLAADFVMLRQYTDALASPVSVLFYETYSDTTQLSQRLANLQDQIQCIVGKQQPYIPFGKAQQPALWDYADGIDTMQFLNNL